MKHITKVIALIIAITIASAGYVPSADAKGLGLKKAFQKAAAKVEKKKQQAIHPGKTIKAAAEKRTKKFVDRRNKQKNRAVGIAKTRAGDAKKLRNGLRGRV